MIQITQYLRPNGKKRIMNVELDEDHEARAAGLVLSAEVLPVGLVSIYGRRANEPEDKEICEFADNGPGENSPNNVLCRIIDRLHPANTEAQDTPAQNDLHEK